ncbi:MAG: hypothetical protein L6290_12080 [Thermodesulfovibrionales bacterium]|nr:hypothetical protein [Thermodesulfovibrionales bacterium]
MNLSEDRKPIEPAKIVIRFADGKVLKGFTHDFYPNKPIFHLSSNFEDITQEGVKVQVKDLKAVFFVKDFSGDPSYNEVKDFTASGQIHGRKIEVEFKDGELLTGTTVGYTPDRPGFFLFPVDARSNNERAFIVSASVKKVRFI